MSIVINLFAGPGVGKSTIAAGIYYELKCKGISCELSGEVAKDKVWEDNPEALADQPYIFGKQQHRIRRLYNKVDYIISDSPIVLSIAYSHEDSETFNNYIIEQHNKYKCINFYIERNLYENGYGCIKNHKKALYWYKKAANQNNDWAISKLEQFKENN